MSKSSKGAKQSAKSSKLGVKSDTFTQVSDSESEKVVGGLSVPIGIIRPRLPLPFGGISPIAEKPTLNPTGSDGCCNP